MAVPPQSGPALLSWDGGTLENHTAYGRFMPYMWVHLFCFVFWGEGARVILDKVRTWHSLKARGQVRLIYNGREAEREKAYSHFKCNSFIHCILAL